MDFKKHISIAIIIAALILGGFYFYIKRAEIVSGEKQVQMKIDQENYLKQLEQQESIKQVQMKIDQENYLKQLEQESREKELADQKAKEEDEARIKQKCSTYLDRNGNFLVSNETLITNYNNCLHSNGL